MKRSVQLVKLVKQEPLCMQWEQPSIQLEHKTFVSLQSFKCFLEISVFLAAEYNAMRGESNVQGSTDFGLLYDNVPGYIKAPKAT